jgi:hypothetical protein
MVFDILTMKVLCASLHLQMLIKIEGNFIMNFAMVILQ